MKKLVLLVASILIFVARMAAQNVGVNTTTPLAKLHVDVGASMSSGILFTGTGPAGGTFPSLGEGYRLMYYPNKGVFRAGYVSGTQWDNVNVGSHSFAVGYGTTAKGAVSFASGDATKALGTISSAFGNNTITKGYSSFVVGMFNDSIIVGANENAPTENTPLFMVGNGDGYLTRHNAMVILKDGRVGMGTNTPANQLSVQGNANISGTIGIGIPTPNVSAQLEVNSTTKGFLPPRLSIEQRDSIEFPVAGLIIWCIECGAYGQLQVYNGITWTNLMGGFAETYEIGDTYQGGIVAYIFQPGDPGYVINELHGLIAAPNDQPDPISWGCHGIDLPGADGLALGEGNQNTIDIVNGCPDTSAARVCYALELGGYNDWYLPSADELYKLYLSRDIIGGFFPQYYWSSSEFNLDAAWDHFFSPNDVPYASSKTFPDKIRAIRSF